ncbi:hypothetical protein [Lentzea sp. NPDC059081]|uniref:hypothetical protein n=1 Tax=Lentzea sp. NPDC059081 TaxID=3346719 RepID=UPI0036962E54
MRRKNVGVLAALAAFGAVVLGACGAGAQSGAPVPGAAQETRQEQPADTTVDGVDLVQGTNKSAKAGRQTGDLAPEDASADTKTVWVQLRAAAAGGLEPAVVNGADRTIYWFSDDPVNGKVSNCVGDCAKKWPPVLIKPGSKVLIAGIKKENIGFFTRSDGGRQVTIGGRPIYRFSGDNPGDIKGQNVAGKWFVINPEGKRATAPGEAAAQPTSPSTPAGGARPANSVTFFTGRNFDDSSGDNFATGVTVGTTCSDLPVGFRSLTTDGAVKIWSEPGCKGKSAVAAEDLRDTTAFGLPNGVRSYIRA